MARKKATTTRGPLGRTLSNYRGRLRSTAARVTELTAQLVKAKDKHDEAKTAVRALEQAIADSERTAPLREAGKS